MDPLSIVVLTTTILSIVAQTANFGRALKKMAAGEADPQLKSAHAKLFNERHRLSSWKHHLSSIEEGTLKRYLTAEEHKMLKELLDDAEQMSQDAHKMFTDINIEDIRHTVIRLKRGLQWTWGGYRLDLQALLDAMHNINNALERIVKPPPVYDSIAISMTRNNSASPANMSRLVQGPSETAARGDSPLALPIENRDSVAVTATARPPRTLRMLHFQGLKGIREIQNHSSAHFQVDGLVVDLSRWGEMLEGQLALDDILGVVRGDDEPFAELGEVLVLAFIDILLIEECILAELVCRYSDLGLSDSLMMVTASLGLQGVMDIALERDMTLGDFDNEETLLQVGHDALNYIAKDLYTLLPMIRSIRRGALLDAESQGSDAQKVSSDTVTKDTRAMIKDVVSVADPYAKSSASRMDVNKAYGSIVEKTQEYLREWSMNCEPNLSSQDRSKIDRALRAFLDKQNAQKQLGSEQTADQKARLDSTENSEQFCREYQELFNELQNSR